MASTLGFRQVLNKSGLALGADLTGQLISRMAGYQAYRREKHPERNPNVTRSMLLVALNDLDASGDLGQVLTQSRLDWALFLKKTGLEDFLSVEPTEDVQITQEFAQTLMQLGESVSDDDRLSAASLGFHLLQSAIDDSTGSLRERLISSKANLDRLKVLVSAWLDSKVPEGRPTVWLLQYKSQDEWTPKVKGSGDRTRWYSRKKVKGIGAGDPVLYWRTNESKSGDRGGLMGIGRFLPEPAAEEDKTNKAGSGYWTEVLHWYPDKLIEGDELIEATGLEMDWNLGSIQPIPVAMAERIFDYLESRFGLVIPPVDNIPQSPMKLLGDIPSLDEDYLQATDTAFILAARLNRVWLSNNAPDSGQAGNGGPDHAAAQDGRGWLARGWLRLIGQLNCLRLRGYSYGKKSTYVVHIDAPWGGGKTSFANYLQAILNPSILKNRRPDWFTNLDRNDPKIWPSEFPSSWYTVCFNAWVHQHMDPPWWILYQAVRQQCFDAVLKDAALRSRLAVSQTRVDDDAPHANRSFLEKTGIIRFLSRLRAKARWLLSRLGALVHWFLLWLLEVFWRLFTPKVSLLVLALIGTVIVSMILGPERVDPKVLVDLISSKDQKDQIDAERVWLTTLMVLFGGATTVWTLVAAFTQTLLPGTPEAAKNYSLGSSDPFDRFRRHFSRIICMMHRPVMVVIDDIDRCEPGFVVELMRGIQTLFRSSRLVFVVLGDRRWIEQSYSVIHKNMSEIQAEAEHSFGGRFVEKVFQLSLVLPGVEKNQKTRFVYGVLGFSPSQETAVEPRVKQSGKTTSEEKDERLETTEQRQRMAVEKEKHERVFTQAMESASNPMTELKVQLALQPVTKILPSNPRQIKRIINNISFYQEIARLRYLWGEGTAGWRKLALWVIVMTEWPTSWKILASNPDLIDKLRNLRRTGVDQSAADQETGEIGLFTPEEILAVRKMTSSGRSWISRCTTNGKTRRSIRTPLLSSTSSCLRRRHTSRTRCDSPAKVYSHARTAIDWFTRLLGGSFAARVLQNAHLTVIRAQ